MSVLLCCVCYHLTVVIVLQDCFLNMSPAWYQTLIKVLLSRFPQNCRHFKDDGGIQYLVRDKAVYPKHALENKLYILSLMYCRKNIQHRQMKCKTDFPKTDLMCQQSDKQMGRPRLTVIETMLLCGAVQNVLIALQSFVKKNLTMIYEWTSETHSCLHINQRYKRVFLCGEK